MKQDQQPEKSDQKPGVPMGRALPERGNAQGARMETKEERAAVERTEKKQSLPYNEDSRVHYVRQTAGLSKHELARMSRTTVRTIERWEKLVQLPERSPGLSDLCNAMHMSSDYFTKEEMDLEDLPEDFTKALEERRTHKEELEAYEKRVEALYLLGRELLYHAQMLKRHEQEILKWESEHIMDL